MMSQFENIGDWVTMNYNVKDNRLKDLFSLFKIVSKKMTDEISSYGGQFLERHQLSAVYTDCFGMRNGVELIHNKRQKQVKDYFYSNGVFSLSVFYGNFPKEDFSFYYKENKLLAEHFETLDYYQYNPKGYYGPNSNDRRLDLMYDALVESLPSVYDKRLNKLLCERINFVGKMVEYHRRLANINEKVNNIFEKYQEQMKIDLEIKKTVLVVTEYESYQRRLQNNFYSMQNRFFYCTGIIGTTILN